MTQLGPIPFMLKHFNDGVCFLGFHSWNEINVDIKKGQSYKVSNNDNVNMVMYIIIIVLCICENIELIFCTVYK